jgi:catechol 2,3-dioxygenase-like lactoylglutathione lyase family enzyme
VIDAQRIDFIVRPVGDLPRADDFYGKTLGLARNRSSDEHWVEYETGNLTIALSEHGGIAFGVADVEEARQTLEEVGVEFPRKIYDSGVCHTTGFTDPAGNRLFLHHRYAPLERWDGEVMGIDRTDFIGVPVTDRPKAVEFYRETLGLEQNTRASDKWPEFEPGNATVLLNTPEQTGTPFRPSNYAIALRVPDVAESMEQLMAVGVEFQFQEPYDSGVCHMAFFNDPDGNSLILHHRHKPYSDGSLP